MTRSGTLVVMILLSLLTGGCHRETSIERGVRQYREKQQGRMAMAALETMQVRTMTDEQLIQAYSRSGLGLGIRSEKTELRVGDSLTLYQVYENLAARVPISATTCQGFSLTSEDEAGQSVTANLSFACSPQDMLHDNNLELPKGQRKTAEINTGGTNLRFPHPGRYRLTAAWQSFRQGDKIYLAETGYPPLESNALLITVR
jgi:hypothetical protein